MDDASRRNVAVQYFQRAYEAQMSGELKEAVRLYQKSLEILPTAEAFTFLGWTYSFMGDFDQAIVFCQKAIEVDPAYGNPYNDIGAYLIEKGKLDEAIPYFKKAIRAERYETHFFPHFNLGRVYEMQGLLNLARQEYETALQHNPNYLLARSALEKLSTTIQ
jgi:tetratricopeptide (TPR) repeat protein